LPGILRASRVYGRQARWNVEVAKCVAFWPVSRDLVNGLRETFGLVGVPIRLSMRAGSDNPYAPKKRRG
jgi:hypothetical protein